MNSQDIAMQLPSSFYIIVGTFIVANIGAIITFFWGGIKFYGEAVRWKTVMEMRVTKNEKDISNAWAEIKSKQDKAHA